MQISGRCGKYSMKQLSQAVKKVVWMLKQYLEVMYDTHFKTYSTAASSYFKKKHIKIAPAGETYKLLNRHVQSQVQACVHV